MNNLDRSPIYAGQADDIGVEGWASSAIRAIGGSIPLHVCRQSRYILQPADPGAKLLPPTEPLDDMSDDSKDKDLTAVSGSNTDVARLGRGAVPAHEQSADQDIDVADWDRVAATREFRNLIAAKLRFVIPATLFFLIYYFTLPVFVGYAPALMKIRIGVVNLAYLFALSQFFMAWAVAALYVRSASRWDVIARDLLRKLGLDREGK